jgi:pimeloyl-ACP methyl ester carboxylesterase
VSDRPLVVMLPALGLDAAMYAPLERILGARAELLALDYPELDEPERLFERVAEHFASRVGRAPAIVGGLSFGGTLAISLARRLSARAMLLVAPGGLRVERMRREVILRAIAAEAPVPFARRSLGLDSGGFERSPFRRHFAEPSDAIRAYDRHLDEERWAPATALRRARAYAAMLRAALDVDLEESLRENALPVDLVWGEEDRVFSARTRERYLRTVRGATVHLFPGAGHFAPLDVPEKLAEIVLRRLDDVF